MKIVKPRDGTPRRPKSGRTAPITLPTDRRVLFGHHAAAIAGAGPLVARCWPSRWAICRAPSGSSSAPSSPAACRTTWCLPSPAAAVGRSLGQMARDELGVVGGVAAIVGVLVIMVILLAVLALVVVARTGRKPVGVFSIAMTIPTAPVHGAVSAVPASWLVSGGVADRGGAAAVGGGVRRLGGRNRLGRKWFTCRRSRCRGASSSTGWLRRYFGCGCYWRPGLPVDVRRSAPSHCVGRRHPAGPAW